MIRLSGVNVCKREIGRVNYMKYVVSNFLCLIIFSIRVTYGAKANQLIPDCLLELFIRFPKFVVNLK
ncbi:hypothetical protein VNO80_24172 [Phaseolus coccineus]|uniref:Uncharacterized protein n=1 Tax=Phaseolus coccineus TaxID=3886 RepID=A0AAN9LT29_PHACN